MTTLEELRLRIQDYLRTGYDEFTGDGDTVIFKLRYSPVQDYVVMVEDEVKTEGSDYTINVNSGHITFTEAPADGAKIKVLYNWAAFTDVELNTILDKYTGDENQVLRASIDAIRILLVNAAKRFSYSQGEIKVDANQVYSQLKETLKVLQEELEQSSGSIALVERVHAADEGNPSEEIVKDLTQWGHGYLKKQI